MVYADVEATRNRVVVDYWLFYFYNDFVVADHEGDWERVRVEVSARSLREALTKTPNSVGLSEHQCDGSTFGLASRSWSAVEANGTHPVVYVARGSHANYFDDGVLGVHSISSCTLVDMTSPGVSISPGVVRINCGGGDLSPIWVAFDGRWGEVVGFDIQSGPYGPCSPSRDKR